ncbi:hypothetical protein FGG08_004205 [Glutinoglossum americanum]|uniref:Uncharacterized protein n=1 Tax=Glutinoglossum americanum TaxID=1670608 RepID=A0A9P8L442_9PEZI|nr:hypothetical protein FGG08_004205 [Glutinoglossum americanum]
MNDFWNENPAEQAQELGLAKWWKIQHEVNLKHLSHEQKIRSKAEDYHCSYDGWYRDNLYLESPESSFTAKSGDTYRCRGRCLVEIIPRKREDDQLYPGQSEGRGLGEEDRGYDKMSLSKESVIDGNADNSVSSKLSSMTSISLGPSDTRDRCGGAKTSQGVPMVTEEAREKDVEKEDVTEEDVMEEDVEEDEGRAYDSDTTANKSDSSFTDLSYDDSAYNAC